MPTWKFSLILIVAFCSSLPPATADDGETTPAKEKEFKPLFNGKDLDGWIGAVNGYEVVDGCIVCKPKTGGNLMTEKEYSNFVLKFEFKLPEGANNGLGLRVPKGGHGAYDGMELQILDNTADQYKNLKPYQYHGSLYGLVPAERGHLKPVGQWNEQTVTADGDKIEVVLNGHTIMTADLAKLRAGETMDGNKHPGLERESGHLGFLGHGSAVEFRNIRIKELK